MRPHTLVATAATAVFVAGPVAAASADVFNGRIAFSSFRNAPQQTTGDIFTMNPDGSDLRQLTENPADDAQSDWSPDGRDITYRIRRPKSTVNFEVARMTARGEDHQRLTFTPEGQASSQPSWFPDKSAILFRRSGPGSVASIWQMGPFGQDPLLRYDPTGPQLYPSLSPDMSKVMFATTTSPRGDTDRAIQTVDRDGSNLTTLFDVVGAYDSAPAWSPDGTRIAFESNSNAGGANPERDMEVWIMNADGSQPVQLTHNALHDEGPAWSPDGTLLAYSSGDHDLRLDINVMTATGGHLRRLTDYPGRDESPDWQPIPAPDTERRCGDLADTGAGAHDVRAAGDGLSCEKALELAARWSPEDLPGNRPTKVGGFDAAVTDFGGTYRVVLTHRGNHDDTGNDKLVAFLYQQRADS
jgi:dipeptidyl aminopeptidase/acylaminoacyl peptidase